MYLCQTPDAFDDYLRLYQDSWDELPDSHGLMEYGDRTLYSTWNLSFKRVEAQGPEAAELLRFTAYLGNVDIWYELFKGRAEDGPFWLSQVATSRVRFNRAMGKLQDYGLVEVRGHYSMHTCMHDWTLDSLNRPVHRALYGLAFDCVVKSIDAGEVKHSSFAIRCRLTAHAVRLDHDRFQALMEEASWKRERYADISTVAGFLQNRHFSHWPRRIGFCGRGGVAGSKWSSVRLEARPGGGAVQEGEE
jgi:hypothetical protein